MDSDPQGNAVASRVDDGKKREPFALLRLNRGWKDIARGKRPHLSKDTRLLVLFLGSGSALSFVASTLTLRGARYDSQ